METTLATCAARTQRAGTCRRKNTLAKLTANIHASQILTGSVWAAITSIADIGAVASGCSDQAASAPRWRSIHQAQAVNSRPPAMPAIAIACTFGGGGPKALPA